MFVIINNPASVSFGRSPVIDAAVAGQLEAGAGEGFGALADKLCERHPAISTNERVLGGMPHLKGLRISVPHILAHLHHLGSVDAIVAEFKQRVSAEQVKQALAYAHDFMEMACDPSEDDD